MAGDPLRKVVPGNPLVIPAAAYNAFVDAANAYRESSKLGGGTAKLVPTPGVILCRNAVEIAGNVVDLPQWSVVGIGDPIIEYDSGDADGNVFFLGNDRRFIAELPSAANHANRFALALSTVYGSADAVGNFATDGIYPCKVDVVSESHEFAGVKDGSVEMLLSADSGPAQILWKESGTGTKWALIRFPVSSAVPFDPLLYAPAVNTPFAQFSVAFGPSDQSRFAPSGNVFSQDCQSAANVPQVQNDQFTTQHGDVGYMRGKGTAFALRSFTSKTKKQTSFVWEGTTIIGGVREARLPNDIETVIYGDLLKPFVLADELRRTLWYKSNAAPYTHRALVNGTHGANVTGTLVAKANFAQANGSPTLTVTTAANIGALTLFSGNDLAVGTGANQRVYRLDANASAGAGVDVSLSLEETLVFPLVGGEPVVLVPSWKQEHEFAVGEMTVAQSSPVRGRPTTEFVVAANPVASSANSAKVAKRDFYFNGTVWSQLDNVHFANAGMEYSGTTFSDVAACSDGTIWAVGSVRRTDPSETPEIGFFRYDSGTWTHFVPALPSGYVQWTSGNPWASRFIYLPDGRLILSIVAQKSPADSFDYVFLFSFNEDDTPDLVQTPDGPFRLYCPFGSGINIVGFPIGCRVSGTSILLYNLNITVAGQVVSSPSLEYIPIVTSEIVELRGAVAEGEIVGTLFAKTATVQPIGQAFVTVTTGSGSSIELKDGDRIKIGTGTNARYYFLTADVTELSENTDASLPISPALELALAGGEDVVLSDGWQARVEHVGYWIDGVPSGSLGNV